MSEKEILTDRLREINERLAKLMVELANQPTDGSYQRQELLTEKNELVAQRRVAQRKLGDLAAPPPAPDERRKKFIDAEVAVRREGTLAWIEKLERAGDFRNARLWRSELLNLREQVEREYPTGG